MGTFTLQPFFDAPVYFSSKGYAGDHCHGHTTTLQVIYTCPSQTVRIFRIAYIGYAPTNPPKKFSPTSRQLRAMKLGIQDQLNILI